MKNNSTADEQILDKFLKESLFYLMNLCDFKTVYELKESSAFEYLKNAVLEITQAMEKKNGTIKQEIESCKANVYPEYLQFNYSEDMIGFKSFGGSTKDAIVLCKKNGVFPYYTTFIEGAALYYAIQKQTSSLVKEIIKNGVRQTIAEMMHLEFEPEIVYLIVKAYKDILAEKAFSEDKKKIDLMKSAYEEGFRNESLYGGCSQCVMKSFYTVTKIEDEKSLHLFKAASSLAGGVAGCNDGTCGALIGAGMIIGSLLGRKLESLEDKEDPSYDRSNDVFRKIRENFVETYNSTLCNHVHSCIFGRKFNFRNQKDFEDFENAGAHVDKCCCVVGMTSAWLCEALYNEKLI